MTDAQKAPAPSETERAVEADYLEDREDNDCWQCGGEGFVVNCFEEYACVDPEGGCDLCTTRCDVCSPSRLQEQG